MGRISFLVSTLLAFALAFTVLAAALLVGLIPTGPGGVAVATTPASPQSSLAPSSPALTAVPSTPPASLGPSALPTAGGIHIVQPGESLSTIGEKYGVPWILIAQANGIAEPYVIQIGQQLIIPVAAQSTAGAEFHIVESGDTVTSIALSFGVDPTDLADFNRLADWNSIQVGDILYIPGPGWTPLPTPAS